MFSNFIAMFAGARSSRRDPVWTRQGGEAPAPATGEAPAPATGEAPAPAPGELRSIHASLDGVNNHNVMLFDLNSCALENFECHYNKYCAQQDLKPFLKEELQAELASRFDCKFKRVRISA